VERLRSVLPFFLGDETETVIVRIRRTTNQEAVMT